MQKWHLLFPPSYRDSCAVQPDFASAEVCEAVLECAVVFGRTHQMGAHSDCLRAPVNLEVASSPPMGNAHDAKLMHSGGKALEDVLEQTVNK